MLFNRTYLQMKEKFFIVDDFNSAIQLLKLYSFDLVISDIMMPAMDGYKILTKLRADSDLCHIPVIF